MDVKNVEGHAQGDLRYIIHRGQADESVEPSSYFGSRRRIVPTKAETSQKEALETSHLDDQSRLVLLGPPLVLGGGIGI